MKRGVIRKLLRDNPEAIILEPEEYDAGAVGTRVNEYTSTSLPYSFAKLVEALSRKRKCDPIDIIDEISYDTMTAIINMGANAPIIDDDLAVGDAE